MIELFVSICSFFFLIIKLILQKTSRWGAAAAVALQDRGLQSSSSYLSWSLLGVNCWLVIHLWKMCPRMSTWAEFEKSQSTKRIKLPIGVPLDWKIDNLTELLGLQQHLLAKTCLYCVILTLNYVFNPKSLHDRIFFSSPIETFCSWTWKLNDFRSTRQRPAAYQSAMTPITR